MASSAESQASTRDDTRWMRLAIGEARRAQGRSGENPPVGCVILSCAGDPVGIGHTAPGGRPHAETQALAMAGRAARGGTAYVTLEPCAHTAKTGPCAEALAGAGIARVVAARIDPDSRVNAKGMAYLAGRGVATQVGPESHEAGRVMAGYLGRFTRKRPVVLLKTAASLDGRIAGGDGAKRWITGEHMRRFVHEQRSRADGILTAIGTVRADDPRLTCRRPGLEGDSPARFVLDSKLRTPPHSALFEDAGEVDITIFAASDHDVTRARALAGAGACIVPVECDADGRPDLVAVLGDIAARGCGVLMVEAGGRLAASLLGKGLVDRVMWTQSRSIMGGDGIAAVAGIGGIAPETLSGFEVVDEGVFGDDRFIMLECKALID